MQIIVQLTHLINIKWIDTSFCNKNVAVKIIVSI
jgi:hypothetical protein